VLATLAAMSLLSLACLDEGPVLSPSDAASEEDLAPECEKILGQAFASPEQRQWFIDNCSTWPEREVASAAVVTAPPKDSPECAQMRGKPYESAEQREWFLTNCVNGSGGVNTAQDPGSGPDRTDCNAMRGTAYRSDAERQWFLANCLRQVSQPQTTNNSRNESNDDDDRGGNEDDDDNRGNRDRRGRD
jgi:hypothetical protein